MTSVVIHGLVNRASLINALAAVMERLNHDDAFEVETHTFLPDEAIAPTVDRPDSDHTAPPTPFVPCPQRGSHTRLTDCWMCWSDVMRGAALEPQVLTARAWQLD